MSSESRRGQISEFVGGIPIVNTSYSGDLTGMSEQALRAQLDELVAADPDDEHQEHERPAAAHAKQSMMSA